MLAALVGPGNAGPRTAGSRYARLGSVALASVVLAGTALAGTLLAGTVLAAAPAYAAYPPNATLSASTSGGPNQSLAAIFRWQKPSHNSAESCGHVDFTFDSWPLGTLGATNQGYTCAASYFGPPPLLDRTPGKHTILAKPDAKGVPSVSATYTIIAPAPPGTTPTGPPTATGRATPTGGATSVKTSPARPASASATPSGPTDAPSGSDGAVPGSTGAASPAVLASGTDTGGGLLAWLLVLSGVLGLGATGTLTAIVVRRARRLDVDDL